MPRTYHPFAREARAPFYAMARAWDQQHMEFRAMMQREGRWTDEDERRHEAIMATAD